MPILVGEGFEVAGVGSAGVVDQNVQAAERGSTLLDQLADLLSIGDIGPLRVHRAARSAQSVCCSIDLALITRTDRDMGALGDQLLGDGETDSLGAAGHQRTAAGEVEFHLRVGAPGRRCSLTRCMLQERLPRRREHVDLLTGRVLGVSAVGNPGGDHRDIAGVHGAHITVDLEFELALEHDGELLLDMHVHRSDGVAFERHEVDQRPVAEHRPERQSRNEFDGFDVADTNVAPGAGRCPAGTRC